MFKIKESNDDLLCCKNFNSEEKEKTTSGNREECHTPPEEVLEEVSQFNLFERLEQTSEIFINKKNAGFSITTDECGHRISNVTKLLFPDLHLCNEDRLISIQNMDVQPWSHDIITHFVQHVFKAETCILTMVIQRSESFIEYKIIMTDLDCDVKELVLKIQRYAVHNVPRSFKKVTNANYSGERKCLISHRVRGDDRLYLRINEKGKLELDFYRSANKRSYCFGMVEYIGVQQRLPNKKIEIHFCLLVTEGRCLTIKGLTKIGLTTRPKQQSLECLTHPDPRYFILQRTLYDETKETIESLVHPGLYVAVKKDSRKLMLSNNDSKDDTKFEIYFPKDDEDIG